MTNTITTMTMTMTHFSLAVFRLQYRIVRFPFQLIEDRLIARMDSSSPARLCYERSLGSLDATVGGALRDSGLAERGAALAERSEALRRAAELDATADRTVLDADEEFRARREAAVQEQQKAQEDTKQVAQDARAKADERKRNAARTAAKRTAQVRERAEKAAAERTDAVEDAKRAEQGRISAAEQKVVDAAAEQFAEARRKREEADAQHQEADLIDELVDAEKKKRQADRAAGNGGPGGAS